MSKVELYLGDCLEIMRDIPEGSVDTVVTDPPYRITITPGLTKSTPAFDKLLKHNWINDMGWIESLAFCMMDGARFYIFTCDDDISYLRQELKKFDLRVNSRLTWIKTNPLPSYQKVAYRSSTELALYGNKGSKVGYFSDNTQQDLLGYWFFPIVGGHERSDHPTQKPVDLIKIWIEDSTKTGDLVFDPFMGSGTTGVAAIQTGRDFIGIEINPDYYKIAEERITKAQLQMRLPI